MSFLDDAYKLGILRQAGGVYEFRHALLQERLATDFLKHRAAWVQEHRTILYARSQLAVSRLNAGEDPDAIEHELRALIEKQRQHKNKHGVMWTWDLLIRALREAGHRDVALSEARSYQQYVEAASRSSSNDNWRYRSRYHLAELLVETDHPIDAVSEYTAVLRLAEAFWGEEDEMVMEIRATLTELQRSLGNEAEK